MSDSFLWAGFILIVVGVLAIDLGLFRKENKPVTTKEAAVWTAVWVALALLFNLAVYFMHGPDMALQFATGYLVEYALSIDNIFVFIMLFSYFGVEPRYRHKVLFWGIVGAVILRGLLIVVGTALIEQFHWVIYIFGAFLVFSAIKMAFAGEEDPEPEKNPVVTWFRRVFPVTDQYHAERFFVRLAGSAKVYATPLLIVLLVVETTDIMFALDSIPAIFGVTTNAFLVFTSNIFAILGLRSLYFLLDGIMGLFRYLKTGLVFVLGFIGLKMLVSEWFPISVKLSLGVVLGILAISILLSLVIPARPETAAGDDK